MCGPLPYGCQVDSFQETEWTTIEREVAYARGRMILVAHTVRLGDGTVMQYEVDESVPY